MSHLGPTCGWETGALMTTGSWMLGLGVPFTLLANRGPAQYGNKSRWKTTNTLKIVPVTDSGFRKFVPAPYAYRCGSDSVDEENVQNWNSQCSERSSFMAWQFFYTFIIKGLISVGTCRYNGTRPNNTAALYDAWRLDHSILSVRPEKLRLVHSWRFLFKYQ